LICYHRAQSNFIGGHLRALFLLLLLANLLFLAWTRWVVPPSAPTARAATAASQALHPIRLKSEPAAAPTAEVATPAAPSLLAASSVSVGPFIEPADADAAPRHRLRPPGPNHSGRPGADACPDATTATGAACASDRRRRSGSRQHRDPDDSQAVIS